MAEIRVTSTMIREKSTTIKGISENIRTLQNELDQEVHKIKPVWEGEASEAFMKQYAKITAKLKGIYETIGKYAEFLDEAATGFAEAETKNVSSSTKLGGTQAKG